MPKLDEIKTLREQKSFKKRDYRPWNLEGNSRDEGKDATTSPPSPALSYNLSADEVLELSPSEIKNWDYHDRPESELGNIEALANEFKEIGQLQPCIVRYLKDKTTGYKYELIVGERRWRAAQLAELPLRVLVKKLSDSEAAIIQASENYNRQDLSDYARGISYSKLIEEGIITSVQLTKTLCISKQQISRLLSFSKIPIEIIDSIQDMSKISARTAEHIKQLSNKGNDYISAIIKYSEKIRTGEVGHEKLNELVENYINNTHKTKKSFDKLYSRDGIHLFTLKSNANSSASIHFNKDIVVLLEQKNIDLKNIAYKISQILEESITNN